MNEYIAKEIRAHAERDFPCESCGVIIVHRGKEQYIPCKNIAGGDTSNHFIMDSEDFARAEEKGDIVAIVHCHPNVAPKPSQADLVGCERSGVPWIIVNWPTGEMVKIKPVEYIAPLIGRVFSHGVLDCYSLIRDYYKETLNIIIPDFERRYEWWNGSENLYVDNFNKAGFHKVNDLQEQDVILIQLASTKANHAAVYIGNNKILHHPQNRLSGRDMYDGYWRKNTMLIVRHEAFL